jgi:hypothetical protein
MERMAQSRLTLTKEVLKALTAAQGASFTDEQLKEIVEGKIFSIALIGCVSSLGYAGDEKLSFVALDGPFGEFSLHADDVANLNDFRRALQDAANFGHQVMIIKTPENFIASVHLRPCKCLCKPEQNLELPRFEPKGEVKV